MGSHFLRALTTTSAALLMMMTGAGATLAADFEQDALAWALQTGTELMSTGVPETSVSFKDSVVMIDACATAIWQVLPGDVPRRLIFAEIFSGTGKIADKMASYKLRSAVFEKTLFEDGRHDVTRLTGILVLFYTMASLVEHGTAHFSPQPRWFRLRSRSVKASRTVMDRHKSVMDRHWALMDRHKAVMDRHRAVMDRRRTVRDRHMTIMDRC